MESLPAQATFTQGLELAKRLGCTHYVTYSVTTRGNGTDYRGGENIILATHFGFLESIQGEPRFVERFMLGVDWGSKGIARNVHDFCNLPHGGREWHPRILRSGGALVKIA